MSVHISCPGCGITLSFGMTECPVCEETFPCRESDIIYDSEGYRKDPQPDTRPFEEQIKDIEFDKDMSKEGFDYQYMQKPREFDKDAM